MNPVGSFKMLGFIDWISRRRPDIRRLDDLDEDELLDLVQVFDGVQSPTGIRAWQAGFQYLGVNGNWDNYDKVRDRVRELESGMRG